MVYVLVYANSVLFFLLPGPARVCVVGPSLLFGTTCSAHPDGGADIFLDYKG